MKILVTGAHGFIGRNLVCELQNRGYQDIFAYDIDTDPSLLDDYCRECEFIFHLAGVNRPKEVTEFMEGNYGFTTVLVEKLKKYQNRAPIVVSSSIQAVLDNPYGKSKKAGEDYLFEYQKETGSPVYIYRFPNVYGKWSRPNYNGVVATFCHNIARGLPIQISDRSVALTMVYIDDVVDALISCLNGKGVQEGKYYKVPIEDHVTLGEIADLIQSFPKMRKDLTVPNFQNHFEKCLYSTYLSYLPEDAFSYPLTMHEDARGSFSEMIRSADRGQFSVNISHPGITKGNHWHHTKNEKFLVVHGHCLIRFRKVGTNQVITYDVSGDRLEVVDIPCGYTHNITNVGDTDSVTLMWCNECYDPEHPDTFFMEVEPNGKK